MQVFILAVQHDFLLNRWTTSVDARFTIPVGRPELIASDLRFQDQTRLNIKAI
jgi:hypothetical protein